MELAEDDNDDYISDEKKPIVKYKIKNCTDVVEMIGCGLFQIKIGIFHAMGFSIHGCQVALMLVVSAVFECQFNFSPFYVSLIASTNRIGVLIGSVINGLLSDMHGKIRMCQINSILLSVLIFMFTLCKTSWSISLVSFLTGYMSSTFGSIDSYYIDFLPFKYQATALSIGHLFYPLGTLAAQGLAFLLIQNSNWFTWIYTMAVPPIVIFILCIFMPESPQYELRRGNIDSSYKILKKVAKTNKKQIPDEHNIVQPNTDNTSFITLINSLKELKLSQIIPLALMLFVSGFDRISMVLNRPQLNDVTVMNESISNFNVSNNFSSSCVYMSDKENTFFMITITGEILSIPIVIILVNFAKNRSNMIVMSFLKSIFFLLFIIMNNTNVVIEIFSFLLRCLIHTHVTVAWIYSAQYFPENIRTSGLGLILLFYYFGSITAPFYINYIKLLSPVAFYVGLLILEFICGIIGFRLDNISG